MTVKGIEVSGIIYDNEDETARSTATTASQTAATASQTATTASQTAESAQSTAETAQSTAETADEKIGDLADLETTAKTDVVSAINELASKSGGGNSRLYYGNSSLEEADTHSFPFSAIESALGISPNALKANQFIVVECSAYNAANRMNNVHTKVIIVGGATPTYLQFPSITDLNIEVNFGANGEIVIGNMGIFDTVDVYITAQFFDNN